MEKPFKQLGDTWEEAEMDPYSYAEKIFKVSLQYWQKPSLINPKVITSIDLER